ncbi:uncharacterized protein LOC126485061 [Schistocerca serialis cubense]|uniref:uncharacterized protein LOC126485061 n=1 Tax=Schistocerca serialis cubense TaxID=2023355 RepID=UPI00214F2CD2|nr:uncharacterized protein LOC126485061 [Schistocerca serialis cubense]
MCRTRPVLIRAHRRGQEAIIPRLQSSREAAGCRAEAAPLSEMSRRARGALPPARYRRGLQRRRRRLSGLSHPPPPPPPPPPEPPFNFRRPGAAPRAVSARVFLQRSPGAAQINGGVGGAGGATAGATCSAPACQLSS